MFLYKSQGHFGPHPKPQAILPCLELLAETSTSIFGFLGNAEIRELGFRKLQVRDCLLCGEV
jgi:hypothetical protein